MTTLVLRNETEDDVAGIRAVTATAFRDAPHASGSESAIVDVLRRQGALTLSVVAVDEGEIVGHVAFSPAATHDDSGAWFALGPVSVLPGRQRQGIGSRLIRTGLDTLRDRGASGCILVGDPAYYRRFGFEPAASHSPGPDYAPYFMAMPFATSLPDGPFAFHRAFDEAT